MALPSLTVLLGIAMAASVGFGVFIFILSKKPSKEVLLLRPRDKRGLKIPVVKETDIGLICKTIKGIARRYIKMGCAWTFTMGGKVVTRFFGIEGTGYTAIVKGGTKVRVSLEEAVRDLKEDVKRIEGKVNGMRK